MPNVEMASLPRADLDLMQRTIAEQGRRLEKAQHPTHESAALAGMWGAGVAPAFVRSGMLGTKPYRLYKALGLALGRVSSNDAPVESEANGNIQKALDETNSRPTNSDPLAIVYPFNLNFLPSVMTDHAGFQKSWEVIVAGSRGGDPGEVARALGYNPGTVYRETPMSAYADALGGTLVAPPVMGEVAQLMRPIPALQRAGARVVPLPPNGRYVAPKIISPTTGYWITENAAPTETALGTGQWALNAKKLGVIARVPNELYRFAAPSIDAALQADMNRTLELGLDYAGFYGTGGGDEPTGITQYTGTNQIINYTAGSVGVNGNTLLPEDGYTMAGKIEERNFDFEGWIFRTQLWAKVTGVRQDAVIPGDAAGGFVQSTFRTVGQGIGREWDGWPVVTSNIIKNTITKGSATNLSEMFGGAWSKLTIGMYGAIEFAMSNQAGSAFAQDQTLVRGILFCDVGTPYPSAFVKCTSLVTY